MRTKRSLIPVHSNDLHQKGWLITEEKFEYWQQWLVDTNRAYFMENREMVGNQQAVKTLGKGTVGAVVLDRNGNVASGTSTGGWTGKLPGRVGDSPGVWKRDQF